MLLLLCPRFCCDPLKCIAWKLPEEQECNHGNDNKVHCTHSARNGALWIYLQAQLTTATDYKPPEQLQW